MKISKTQNQQLLELVKLDQKLKQMQLLLQKMISGESVAELKAELSTQAAELLRIHNEFEGFATEVSRTETDLHTVEQRIDRDRERLNQSSSTKDIQGIEAELATLLARKSTLEDVELAQLESLEDAKRQLDEMQLRHDAVSASLTRAQKDLEAEIAAARADLDETANDRAKLHVAIGSELAELYDRKSARGTAAGRLSSGECGACRMQIGAVDLDHLLATPVDEVVFCPECQAILVRD